MLSTEILDTSKQVGGLDGRPAGTSPPVLDIRAVFLAEAWDAAMDNLDQNESELSDAVSDYEDETGKEIGFAPGMRLARGGELSDPAFEAWYRARVGERAEKLAAEILSLVMDGRIRAWRSVMQPPAWDARTAPHVGVHWSRDVQKALPVFGDAGGGNVRHLVEAWLPVGSVDWPRTVAANLSEEFGIDEDELRLLDDAPYEIIGVTTDRRRRKARPA